MQTILSRPSHILLVSLSPLLLVFPAHADIYEWEYINPADPSQGKRQSTTLAPDGAGVDAVLGADLSGRDLTKAYLLGADLAFGRVCDPVDGCYLIHRPSNLSGTNLTQADLSGASLTGANVSGAKFREANLSTTNLNRATLTGADFTGADVRGASGIRIAVNEPTTTVNNWAVNDFTAFTGNRTLTSNIDAAEWHQIELRLR